MTKISTQLSIVLLILLNSLVLVTACTSKTETEQRQPDAVSIERQPIALSQVRQNDQRLQLSIPNAPWVSIFFKSLETDVTDLNLPGLKTVVFPNKDDLEMRFWINALPNGLYGIILQRVNNNWSAVRIQGKYEHGKFPLSKIRLGIPKSGWNEAWKKLVDSEILTLPDGTEVNCNVLVLDGASIVIETNFNWAYRVYGYGNPHNAKCNEAKRIISITSILFEEFSLEAVKF